MTDQRGHDDIEANLLRRVGAHRR